MRSTQELCQKLREFGYKVTPQRRCVFGVLEVGKHLSADEVYDQVRAFVPDISLATVYNTLRGLVGLGEIRELDLGEGKSRFDSNTDPHQHLVCVRCHTVADVASESRSLRLTPEQSQGYVIIGADVAFRGVCPNCQKVGTEQ